MWVTVALLVGLLLAGPFPVLAAAPDAPVPVRVESRAGFGRVAFEFPSRVRFRVTREGDRVLVEFTDSRTVNSSDTLARNIGAVTGGPGRAEFVVGPGAQIRPGRTGNRIVIASTEPTAVGRTVPSAGIQRPVPVADNSNNCHSLDSLLSLCAGASSSTTCTFVPPTPSEFTPARRGCPLRLHGVSAVFTKKGELSKSMLGYLRYRSLDTPPEPQTLVRRRSKRRILAERAHEPAEQRRQREHVVAVVGEDAREWLCVPGAEVLEIERRNHRARHVVLP